MNACTTPTRTKLVEFSSAFTSKPRYSPEGRCSALALLKWTARGCGIAFGITLLSSVSQAQFAIQELVTGLNNPRALTFGPDGALYIAEAGAPFVANSSTP